jgi:squalene-hopene/tetraprenyl-beta-curcumene cyclase
VSAAPESAPPAPLIDRERLHRALAKARAALLAERGPHGHWEGELSNSALSTATAVTALELWQRNARDQSAVGGLRSAVESGLKWLAEHQNADGGWGDTTLSFSNISTTALCWAAFGAVLGAEQRWPEVVRRAEGWLAEKCLVISNQSSVPNPPASPAPTNHSSLLTNHSPLSRSALITAIIARYGKDRTFSVPILTMCALAGRLGEGKDAWRRVIQLPFELAALPQKFFAALRLPVVSYALPALIAIGQVRHHHLPTRNLLLRLLRDRARAKTLRVLERIQPPNGGFLEATPLTSFVTMSLAGSGHADHPVALRGVDFLLKSVRADGSWPIDTNLATWVTTLAVNALGPSIHEVMSAEERRRILDWLLAQQYRTVHPYTGAAPGGWAWTDLPGGVPDADDTAGALLALKVLSECGTRNAECGMKNHSSAADGGKQQAAPAPHSALRTPHSALPVDPKVREAAIAGVKWLLELQNRDGGIPTFCRGWTNLPFDRSSPDITAHTLRAWLAWLPAMPSNLAKRIGRAANAADGYLRRARQNDGSWSPLWFGNQHIANETNPVYGTAKVTRALSCAVDEQLAEFKAGLGGRTELHPAQLLRELAPAARAAEHAKSGLGWLTAWIQAPSSRELTPSTEELALTLESLAVAGPVKEVRHWQASFMSGSKSLLARVEDGTWTQPAPIGFYFAKLWYYERLYPMVFTVAALEAVARLEAAEK